MGQTGFTAYAGLLPVGRIAKGETVFVTGAGGAVGSMAGQFARLLGAGRVIGSAGGAEKCAWLNQQHLTELSDEAFAAAARPFVETAGLPVGENFEAITTTVKEKVRLLQDVPDAIGFLLQDEFAYETEALEKVTANPQAASLLKSLASSFSDLTDWSADTAKQAISDTAKAAGAKPGQLMFPVRVALSGKAWVCAKSNHGERRRISVRSKPATSAPTMNAVNTEKNVGAPQRARKARGGEDLVA